MHTKAYIKMTETLGFKLGPVRRGVTPKRVLDFVLQDMSRLKDDEIVAELVANDQSCEYLKGMWQAYRNVAHYIAPLTNLNGSATPAPNVGASATVGQLVSAIRG